MLIRTFFPGHFARALQFMETSRPISEPPLGGGGVFFVTGLSQVGACGTLP